MNENAPAAVAASARIPLGLLLLIGALAAVGPFSIDLYLPAFDAIGADLSAGPDQVQATLSAYFVGLAAGQLALGPISDRLGRRGPLLAGLSIYVLASLGSTMAHSIEALSAWRFVQAVGACAGAVTSRAVLRDLFGPRDMARALSMVMLVMGLAPVVAPLIGAAAHEAFGWRALFAGLAVYGAGALVAVFLGLRETLATPTRPTPSQVVGHYTQLLRTRSFMAPSVAGSLAQAALFVYIASSSFVFTSVYGLSSTAFALLFGGNAVGLIAASQVNERLLRRTTPERVVLPVLLVQAAAGLALLGAAATGFGGIVGFALPLFVVIACVGFCYPNTTAVAMADVGDRAGLAAALLGTLQFGVAGLATFAVGLVFDGTALPMGLAIAGFSLAGGLAWLSLTPRGTVAAHPPSGADRAARDRR